MELTKFQTSCHRFLLLYRYTLVQTNFIFEGRHEKDSLINTLNTFLSTGDIKAVGNQRKMWLYLFDVIR